MRVNVGGLDLLDERRQVHVGAREPRRLEQLGEQDVFARLQRVGLDADQPQQARHRGLEPLAEQVAILEDGSRGGPRTT